MKNIRRYEEKDIDLDTFGGRLLYLMKQRKMTQNELAKKIGVSEKTIWRYIHERSNPNIETINYISDVFRVSADFLLDNKKDKFPEGYSYFETYGMIRKNIENWSEEQIWNLIRALRNGV